MNARSQLRLLHKRCTVLPRVLNYGLATYSSIIGVERAAARSARDASACTAASHAAADASTMILRSDSLVTLSEQLVKAKSPRARSGSDQVLKLSPNDLSMGRLGFVVHYFYYQKALDAEALTQGLSWVLQQFDALAGRQTPGVRACLPACLLKADHVVSPLLHGPT